jgi:hypothetical protein
MTAPFDYSKASPSALLASAMVFGSNGFIESQESEGQKDLCASTALPVDGAEAWETLQSWGVVKGDKLDDLFFNATLPTGWSLKPSSHSMWSYLHDDRGLKRASVFYKAAFYDRSAHIGIDLRFHVFQDCELHEADKIIKANRLRPGSTPDRGVTPPDRDGNPTPGKTHTPQGFHPFRCPFRQVVKIGVIQPADRG